MGQDTSKQSKQTFSQATFEKPAQSFIDISELGELLLDEKTKDTVLIVDVRGGWDGDFKGGHITNAVNIPYQDLLHNNGWNKIIEQDIIEKGYNHIIFHCMYSMVRGPASYDRFVVIINQIMQKYCQQQQLQQEQNNKSCCGSQDSNKYDRQTIELKQQQLKFTINGEIYNALQNIKISILKGGFYDWIEKYMQYYSSDKEMFDKLVTDYDPTIWSKKSKNIMQQQKDEQQINQKQTIQNIANGVQSDA